MWQRGYEGLANQFFLHRNREYVPPSGSSRYELDEFIKGMNSFLNILVKELTEADFVVENVVRNAEHLQKVKTSAHDFFSRL